MVSRGFGDPFSRLRREYEGSCSEYVKGTFKAKSLGYESRSLDLRVWGFGYFLEFMGYEEEPLRSPVYTF